MEGELGAVPGVFLWVPTTYSKGKDSVYVDVTGHGRFEIARAAKHSQWFQIKHLGSVLDMVRSMPAAQERAEKIILARIKEAK